MEKASSFASAVEQAEDSFFAALRRGDHEVVEEHLDGGFRIVDVNSGSVSERSQFVDALRGGALVFERLELVERATRVFGDAGVVVGRTAMAGTLAGEPFAVDSRYTHVLVRGSDARWRMASAQGTRIGKDAT